MRSRALSLSRGSVGVLVGVAAVLTASGAGPAAAGDHHRDRGRDRGQVVHRVFDEPTISTHVDGLGPGCPDFVGRLVEKRHLVQSGYLRGRRARISTVVNATVRLLPDDETAVGYRGTYRSVQVGTFSRDGQRTIRSTTFTLGRLRGEDGSSFGTVEDARVWRDSDGHVHRSDTLHC